MKILFLASMFPPFLKGGAEICAHQAALWLSKNGHEVGVLTISKDREDELNGSLVEGLRIWRLPWPRAYTPHNSNEQGGLKKILWHIQDHLDPRNETIVERVVREFQPDVVYIHLFVGIGSNALSVFKKLRIPVCYHLHDLALACLRCSMFKNGDSCTEQCRECKLSSAVRTGQFKSLPAPVQFTSPSVNTWNTLRSTVDLAGYEAVILPDIDLDIPVPRVPRASRKDPVRILYVGRVHETKGVTFLLEVLAGIAASGRQFQFLIVGSGPDLSLLRERYSGQSWVTFTGQVPPAEVPGYMSNSDVLCTPSLWRENHPGVVRKAIRAGIPALVSEVGGIPEMVEDRSSGMVLPPGDKTAWTRAIEDILDNEDFLDQLQQGAADQGARYSADLLGERLVKTLQAAITAAG